MNPATKILMTLVLALGLVLAGVSASFAAVWTDQPDYAPGSQVTIHGDNSDGAGYLAGEPVFVEVWGPNGFHVPSEPNNPTADANGAWSWQLTLWNSANAVGEYRYTATGRTSSVSQSGMFSDAMWQILAPSIGPSTWDCLPTITVHATLQTCAGTSCALWVPAVGMPLEFGFSSTAAEPETWAWFPSTTLTDANGQATAKNVGVPPGAATLWARYLVPDQYYVRTSIAFNTPALTLAVSDATYDGKPHGATATLVNPCVDQDPQVYYMGLDHLYQDKWPPIDAGDYLVAAQYESGAVFIRDFKYYTIHKASSSTVVTVGGGESFTYDSNAHPATVAVTGVGGLNLTAAPVYSCGQVPVAVADSGCTVSYTYAGDRNHEGSSGSVTYTIAKAPSTTTVTTSDATYDGNPHGGTAVATGVGGLNQSLTLTYSGHNTTVYGSSESAPTAAGDYMAAASFAGDANHLASTDSKEYTIEAPITGNATGGGWFLWPGTTDKTDFDFTMKYNKSGTNPQGSLLVIRHHQDGTISRIKSNALGGLALQNIGGCGIATFSGKATVKTWDAALGAYVNSGGNAFSVYAEDCNNPGSGVDSFWISGVGNLAMPAPAPSNKAPIGGGNIAVPHTAKK